MGFYLGLDVGQTVTKAVVFDEEFREVGAGSAQSPTSSPQPRFVERSQEALWSAASDAIAEAVKQSAIRTRDIRGVGVAGHGDGLHLVDSNGEPIGQAVMAVDSRAWSEMDAILNNPSRADLILERSGQVPFLGSTGVIMEWFHHNHPDLLESADSLLFCKDVIRNRLTGSVGTDFSDASASFLDVRNSAWSSAVLAAYGLGGYADMLPALSHSADVVGGVSGAGAIATGLHESTPVVAGCHDVHAVALGMGSLAEGTLTLIAGSFSINAVTTTSTATDPRWQSRVSLTPGLRMAMSTSATSSTALEWLLASLGVATAEERDRLFAKAGALDVTEDMPIFLPYVFASPFGQTPSGTFLGLRSWHTPAHLLRAGLEGLVWMHLWHTDALADQFEWSAPIRIGGGISRSAVYSQLVADAMGMPVETVTTNETGALGAAALAATGTGHLSSPSDLSDHVRVARQFEPTATGVSYWQERKSLLYQAHQSLAEVWSNLPSRDVRR